MTTRRSYVYVLCLQIILITGCQSYMGLENSIGTNDANDNYYTIMKQDILSLMMAYPHSIVGVKKETNGSVYILLKSGKKILYDDKRKKSFTEKLANPDIQDMMEQIYPLENIDSIMEENYDPGRMRVYSLLKEVYGCYKGEIEKNLTNVKIGYKNYPFNKENNAASKLKQVMNELLPIANNNWRIYASSFPSSGTFNYRYISGTGRLSPHAFGIAVDLKRDSRDYWKWASKEQGEKRLKEYPKELVKLFEKHGFIWGGKWNHFDILHFEYRPEIIIKAKYFSANKNNPQTWYEGAPFEDEKVKKYITLIDKEFN